jgi:hypothetical protein
MSNRDDDRPVKQRLRGPSLAAIIDAAAKKGRQLIAVTAKPGGVTEFRFGHAGLDEPPVLDRLE